MPKYKLLDLFCCGGGASAGYNKAGFEVTGIDIKPQRGYPFYFIQDDALNYLLKYGKNYDIIHASPPCQGYSKHVSSKDSEFVPTRGKNEPKLIDSVRNVLIQIGKPYIIENVMGAKSDLKWNLLLCGTMFNLPISRHRLFECSFSINQPIHPKCRGVAKKFALENNWDYRDMSVTGKGRNVGTSDRWKQILGIDWGLRQSQISEAIPPSYTKYIGEEWLKIKKQ